MRIIRNTIRICLTLNLFIFSVFAAVNAAVKKPEVLDYFPQCDYQVLEKKTYKYKIEKTNKNSVLTQNDLDKTIEILLRRMQDRATDIQADAILLVDRDIEDVEGKSWTKSLSNHTLLKYTAEIINQCEPIQGRAKKPTPFDKTGAPQKEILLGTLGWQTQIEFAMPSNRTRIEPELNDSLVSIDSGLYGVKLSTSLKQVIKTFGTPTIIMRLNAQQQLIAYGRRHWLWFDDGLLVKVATDAGIFATEFTNLLAFDDRFEAQKWLINGTIKHNDDFRAQTQTTIQDGKTLKVLSDTFLSQSTDKSEPKVIGFELSLNSAEISNRVEIGATKELQDFINSYLESENTAELLISEFNMQPIARIWKDGAKELLLFDHHMVIEVTGKSVSRVFYLENVFNYDNPAKWQFSRVEQGQTLEDVMSVLGDDAFEFDGVVEYSGDKYQKELYFEDVDGKMRLYASEVAIY